MQGPKHVASHTIKHDVFDENCFIILVLRPKPIIGKLQNFFQRYLLQKSMDL